MLENGNFLRDDDKEVPGLSLVLLVGPKAWYLPPYSMDGEIAVLQQDAFISRTRLYSENGGVAEAVYPICDYFLRSAMVEEFKDFLQCLVVVNDPAECSVKLIQDFALKVTLFLSYRLIEYTKRLCFLDYSRWKKWQTKKKEAYNEKSRVFMKLQIIVYGLLYHIIRNISMSLSDL